MTSSTNRSLVEATVADIEARIASPRPFDGYSALLPAEGCRQVIAAIADNAEPASLEEATQLGRRLIEGWRKTEVPDGKTFAANITAVFAEYPVSIGKRVVHPVHGLPGRLKWIPTMAEINDALKSEKRRRDTISATARWMIEERQRREAEAAREAALPSPERRAELAAKARAIMAQLGGGA